MHVSTYFNVPYIKVVFRAPLPVLCYICVVDAPKAMVLNPISGRGVVFIHPSGFS